MKIAEQYGVAPHNSGLRRRRLQALLNAWEMQYALHSTQPTRPPREAEFTGDEWPIWLTILRAALPIPPPSHRRGLEIYVQLAGLNLDELQRDKSILMLDDQVAVRRQKFRISTGYDWAILVPTQTEGLAEGLTDKLLRKRFRNVELYGDRIIASGAFENCTDTVSALVAASLADLTPQAIRRQWELSLALRLERPYFSALPFACSSSLAVLLGAELDAAADRLDLITGARLSLFADGANEALAADMIARLRLQLPKSRLADLLEAAAFLDHTDHDLVRPYYESVASAYARIADASALGNLLLRLPPGRSLLAAIDAVCFNRPSVIATYLWERPFRAEGVFALLRLWRKLPLPEGEQLELTDEWLEAQRLGRELVLLVDDTTDWTSLLALGIHDESKVLAQRARAARPSPMDQIAYDGGDLWVTVFADPEHSERHVFELENYFRARTKHSDASIVFALKLLASLRTTGRKPLAKRLATAIVDGYEAKLALEVERMCVPRALWAHGSLLSELHTTLGTEDEAWHRLLRPFDREAYVRRAQADLGPRTISEEPHPAHDVPAIFRAHAETLVALGLVIEAFDQPLRAALELYDADRRNELGAFAWYVLAPLVGTHDRPLSELLFARIGRLFRRVPGSPKWIRDFLTSEIEPTILGYITAGIGPMHTLSELVQPKLRSMVNDLLADRDGVALGLALELGSQLQVAGMAREAERLATRALDLLEAHPHDGGGDLLPGARALLASALAQQELWPEILALEPQPEPLAFSYHSRFVENMRALALLGTGKPREAEQVLHRVLEAEPTDDVALVNLTALYLQTRSWSKALHAAEAAKAKLPPGDNLDRVRYNEAFARAQIGDKFGAEKLLDAISAAAEMGIAAAEARERLQREEAPIIAAMPSIPAGAFGDEEDSAPPKGNQAVNSKTLVVPSEPTETVDVAIVTALKEEYEAVKARLTGQYNVPMGSNTYPNLYGWVLGTIPMAGAGECRVVVTWAGSSGNLRTAIATMRTIDRWRPRHVLFSGIAGGLRKDELRQGDVVLSQTIWYYEYGKIAEGRYKPRHRDSFPVDKGLLSSARSFDSATSEWKDCGLRPPDPDRQPKLVLGMIGSGEKVIDDLDPPFVRAILQARAELQAIEMEAAGACEAIENARAEGKLVGFLMIRGISDMPAEMSWRSWPARFLHRTAPGSAGTATRDQWKLYASAISAEFVARWLASSWSPVRSNQR